MSSRIWNYLYAFKVSTYDYVSSIHYKPTVNIKLAAKSVLVARELPSMAKRRVLCQEVSVPNISLLEQGFSILERNSLCSNYCGNFVKLKGLKLCILLTNYGKALVPTISTVLHPRIILE